MAPKGDHRRARILSVVADMLSTHEFNEISIAEITRRSEITRQGFYFYFPSKGAAVAALLEDLYLEFSEVTDRWYEHRSDDQPSALREGMAGTVELWRRHAILIHGMIQAAAGDREAREIWEGWIATFMSKAIPKFAEDAGERIAGLGLDVEILAALLVGTAFDAMERDVRQIVETGEGIPGLAASVTYVWTQTLYATPA
jgi:AcrR family transcriptional regulator